jgi:hypothetical protein
MRPDSIRNLVNIRSFLVLKERTNLLPLNYGVGSGDEAWHSGFGF